MLHRVCDKGLSLSSQEGCHHCPAGGGVSEKEGNLTSGHKWVVRSFNIRTFRTVNKHLFIGT